METPESDPSEEAQKQFRDTLEQAVAAWMPDEEEVCGVLEEVLEVIDDIKHPQRERIMIAAKKGGPLHDQALEVVGAVTMLLAAADLLRDQPSMFEVVAESIVQLHPAPVHPGLRLIATVAVHVDKLTCDTHPMKSEFFQHYLNGKGVAS